MIAIKRDGVNIGLGTFEATPKTREYVDKILSSGQITYSEFSKRFEREFSALHGCTYGVLSNSGTSSLQVALQAMKEMHGWENGEKVIVPATTFIATVNIVMHCNMTPVLVDVDADTYNIDPVAVEESIDSKTRAIIPVHMFGQPANMTDICSIAERHGLRIIEDSCETMFATHNERPVGYLGDVGCFSLYAAHLIVGGVGGIATTNDPHLAKIMRSLVNHGMSTEQLNLDDNFSPKPAVGRSFVFDRVGHSYRITEFEAALALAQLDNWKEMIRLRRRNAQHLTRRLERNSMVITPYVDPANTHAWMMYPIILHRFPDGQNKDKGALMKYLNAMGIQTRDMPTLIEQPTVRWIDNANFPVSKLIHDSGFYVGCHQGLSIADMDYIADSIISILGE